MSIQDTIDSIEVNLSNAYDKLLSKRATIPSNKNIENLSDSIDSISVSGIEYDGSDLNDVPWVLPSTSSVVNNQVIATFRLNNKWLLVSNGTSNGVYKINMETKEKTFISVAAKFFKFFKLSDTKAIGFGYMNTDKYSVIDCETNTATTPTGTGYATSRNSFTCSNGDVIIAASKSTSSTNISTLYYHKATDSLQSFSYMGNNFKEFSDGTVFMWDSSSYNRVVSCYNSNTGTFSVVATSGGPFANIQEIGTHKYALMSSNSTTSYASPVYFWNSSTMSEIVPPFPGTNGQVWSTQPFIVKDDYFVFWHTSATAPILFVFDIKNNLKFSFSNAGYSWSRSKFLDLQQLSSVANYRKFIYTGAGNTGGLNLVDVDAQTNTSIYSDTLTSWNYMTNLENGNIIISGSANNTVLKYTISTETASVLSIPVINVGAGVQTEENSNVVAYFGAAGAIYKYDSSDDSFTLAASNTNLGTISTNVIKVNSEVFIFYGSFQYFVLYNSSDGTTINYMGIASYNTYYDIGNYIILTYNATTAPRVFILSKTTGSSVKNFTCDEYTSYVPTINGDYIDIKTSSSTARYYFKFNTTNDTITRMFRLVTTL